MKMIRTDTERLDFIVRYGLSVSANMLGEYQVFEFVPTYHDDGIVTGNSFHGSARAAIDYAIEFFLGGENQYGPIHETVLTAGDDDLDAIGSFLCVNLLRTAGETTHAYRQRLIERLRGIKATQPA